jgi:hypothetical protein
MKERYFDVTCGRVTRRGVVAFAMQDVGMAGYKLIGSLEGKNELPFEMRLKYSFVKKVLEFTDDLSQAENLWPDYMANQLGYIMISERFKNIIESELTGNEGIDWITAKIHANEECRTYYILRFNKILDVLDMEHSRFMGRDPSIPSNVVVPCFSLAKVSQYSVFNMPHAFDHWKIPGGIFVCNNIKKAAKKANLTGVGFSETWVV